MAQQRTLLQQRIESGQLVLLAEISPPRGADPAAVQDAAKRCVGKVHAVSVSDNRDGVRMAALAAASLVAAAGVEPVLHIVTRDRNRIALVSEVLGAQALGVRNLFCTSGTHQTLGPFRASKNVYDLDSVLLLQTCSDLTGDASIVGEAGIPGAGPFCLGGVAAPYADPLELQVLRLAKKVASGAHYLITQPVYDLDRFTAWWAEVTRRGIHEKVAILAGIEPLCDADEAKAAATKRPRPMIPEAMLARLASKNGKDAQRAEGILMAKETIERLSAVEGLRGFSVCGDGHVDVALDVIAKSGLGTN
jgi:methylenetetrahydrofolate reductase (NADPH)